jgi:ribosomal protein S18 acetylase RimI-like enzyme
VPDGAPVSLDPSLVDAAAGVLVRAFPADPGLLFVLPDPADRARLGPALARAVVRFALRCGSPVATPDPVRGVALWFAPDDLVATGIGQVPGLIGPEAWARFKRLLTHLDALHPRYAPDPHWYLALLGVDPACQRQGIGEALLRPVFAQADRAGAACYLEAPTAENARYYARRGFRVLAETDVPASDVHVWLMQRDPASGAPATDALTVPTTGGASGGR